MFAAPAVTSSIGRPPVDEGAVAAALRTSHGPLGRRGEGGEGKGGALRSFPTLPAMFAAPSVARSVGGPPVGLSAAAAALRKNYRRDRTPAGAAAAGDVRRPRRCLVRRRSAR